MKKAKFVPLNDLSSLSEEQKLAYYNSVCEYFDVPPELNLLYFDWFDSGDGARKYLLYAAKGFTDMMRGKLGIETDSLDESVSDGVVRYKCKGHDMNGRHEIAIGASVISGLTGKKLEDAFAKAQTKATRRMTLQFVGAGILDESEKPVNSLSVDISAANLPLAQLPTVEVNTQKGKDVTFTSEMEQSAFVFPNTTTEIANGELRRRPGPIRGEDLNAPVSTAAVTFKSWLSWITNDVLPPPPPLQSGTFMTYGGMKATKDVGGVSMKVRAFARKIFPGKELDKLSLEEQNEFKLLFENKLKEVGSKGLVQYINDMLGVKEA